MTRHLLKRNQTTEQPRRWLCVGTEWDARPDGDELRLTLTGGWARRWYSEPGRDRDTTLDYPFRTPAEFWRIVDANLPRKSRLVVISTDLGRDARLLETFATLTAGGWEVKRFIEQEGAEIWSFRRGDRTLLMLSCSNYLPSPETEILERFGSCATSSGASPRPPSTSWPRAHRAATAAHNVAQTVVTLMRGEDNGHFAPTLAGLAFNIYRHRHMAQRPTIDREHPAVALERDSYFGGRVTAYRRGLFVDGPYSYLDINGSYGAIMHAAHVPQRRVWYHDGPLSPGTFGGIPPGRCIADVTLEADKALYPARTARGVEYPRGRFRTALAGPELALAWQRGEIKRVHRLAVYHLAPLLRSFAWDMWVRRCAAEAAGDGVLAGMYKGLLVSLYGKFAQRNGVWEAVGRSRHKLNSYWDRLDYETREWSRWRNILGTVEKETGLVEAYHSFPAISAFITAHGRAYLRELRETAGADQVYYEDTDALIVTPTGRERLEHLIEPGILGQLKVKEQAAVVQIWSAKWYRLGLKTAHGGATALNGEFPDESWEQLSTEGVVGAMKDGQADTVRQARRRLSLQDITGPADYDGHGWWIPPYRAEDPAKMADRAAAGGQDGAVQRLGRRGQLL